MILYPGIDGQCSKTLSLWLKYQELHNTIIFSRHGKCILIFQYSSACLWMNNFYVFSVASKSGTQSTTPTKASCCQKYNLKRPNFLLMLFMCIVLVGVQGRGDNSQRVQIVHVDRHRDIEPQSSGSA